jgi:carbon monoxide dehydrogenase subunit G
MKLTVSTVIRRSPEAVFAYLADRTNLPEWTSGVSSCRKVTQGAVGPGAKFRIEGKLAGRAFPSAYEITAYEPPARLSGRNTGLLTFHETFSLVPTAQGAEVTQTADLELGGHFFFLAPLLRLALMSQLRKDLATLKRVLEGVPAAATASEAASE